MNELKITKEKVLEAASKCSTAKATLQTLFPEAFKDDSINLYRETGIGNRSLFLKDGDANNSMIALRDRKCFYLSSDFNWELSDMGEYFLLTPTKK